MKIEFKKTITIISTFIFLAAFIFENLVIKNLGFDSLSVGTSYILLIICAIISIGDTIKYNSVNNFFNANFLRRKALSRSNFNNPKVYYTQKHVINRCELNLRVELVKCFKQRG